MSALATNGHVLDKSKTNPFEKTRHGFVYNILTCQDDLDKSVSALASSEKSVQWSLTTTACLREVYDIYK